MNVEVKKIGDEEYKIIENWWTQRKWPKIPKDMLPERGYISFVDGEPIFAGWVYKDETSNYGMFEWGVSSPSADPKARGVGFKALMDHVFQCAFESGVRHLLTFTNSEKFVSRLEGCGFNVADQDVRLLVVNFSEE